MIFILFGAKTIYTLGSFLVATTMVTTTTVFFLKGCDEQK